MAYSSLRSISQQATYCSQIHLTNESLSFQEVLKIKSDQAIKINQLNVYNSYMYHMKNKCVTVKFNSDQAKKYAYKPKRMAYELYGNTDLYTLILRVNYMHSVSDFTEERLLEGIVIPTASITDFLDEVLIKEKNPINRNVAEVLKDVNSLT